MKYNSLSRRMFLQGSGQFLLAMPLLPSLLPKALAQAVTPPVRYFQFVTDHGVFPQFFWPSSTYDPNLNFGTYTDFKYRPLSQIQGNLSTTLNAAFDPYRAKMNLIKGLHGIVNDNWHNNCFPTTGGNPLTDHGTAAFPYSVDFVLEKSAKFYPTQAKVPALRLTPGVNGSYKWGSFSWGVNVNSAPVRFSTYDANMTALSVLFGNSTSGSPLLDPNAAVRLKVTDLVLEDYKRVIAGTKVSAEDKIQLNNYMDLVSQAQKRMTTVTPTTACSAPTLATEVDFDVLHENATDLAVAAMLCGATKVVSYGCFQGSKSMYDEEVFHNWAHGDPTQHTGMSTWRQGKLPILLKKMEAFTEANGKTLLDNSLVVSVNELSDPGHGGNHLKDMPVMTFGSAGGTLNTGNYINYINRPYNSLLVTIFNSLGLQSNDFEKNGAGYGAYTGYLVKNVDAKFLTDTEKRKPLPLLFKGS